MRQQIWSSFSLWLAFLLACATALFITFFEYGDWRDEALRWSQERGEYALASHIGEGEWRGISWQGWAIIGSAGTTTLGLLGIHGFRSASRAMREIPGLEQAVREERDRQREQKLVLLGCLLLLFLLPFAIVWAASRERD